MAVLSKKKGKAMLTFKFYAETEEKAREFVDQMCEALVGNDGFVGTNILVPDPYEDKGGWIAECSIDSKSQRDVSYTVTSGNVFTSVTLKDRHSGRFGIM